MLGAGLLPMAMLLHNPVLYSFIFIGWFLALGGASEGSWIMLRNGSREVATNKKAR